MRERISKHSPGLNGTIEEKGENCKASSTFKSLGWVVRVLLDGCKGATPVDCRRKGAPFDCLAGDAGNGCRGVISAFISRGGVLPFNCDNLFRGTFKACCLDFL